MLDDISFIVVAVFLVHRNKQAPRHRCTVATHYLMRLPALLASPVLFYSSHTHLFVKDWHHRGWCVGQVLGDSLQVSLVDGLAGQHGAMPTLEPDIYMHVHARTDQHVWLSESRDARQRDLHAPSI